MRAISARNGAARGPARRGAIRAALDSVHSRRVLSTYSPPVNAARARGRRPSARARRLTPDALTVAEPARPSRQCFHVASAREAARSESRRTGSELRRKNAPQNEILVGAPPRSRGGDVATWHRLQTCDARAPRLSRGAARLRASAAPRRRRLSTSYACKTEASSSSGSAFALRRGFMPLRPARRCPARRCPARRCCAHLRARPRPARRRGRPARRPARRPLRVARPPAAPARRPRG
jgi:hypothetical protein